jgi:Putative transposase/Transposase zinc-binding domain
LHPRQSRAAWCISNCYGPALGAHVLTCPQGHFEEIQYHACRHRSCPRCAQHGVHDWAEAQLAQLLPCAHFHVIFTLPHDLLKLWEFNRDRLTQLLFDCVRRTLLELMHNPRHLGAMPGLLMSLHTWGRTLSHHPHVHCLLSAGGLDEQQQWRACKPGFLLPLPPLRALFRGKFLGGLGRMLTERALTLPPNLHESHWRQLIRQLYRKHWNIEIRPPYSHGRGVALYLARYVKGGPLPKDRPLELRDGTVRFSYTDHRDGQTKSLCLSALEFIERVLWHAPPRGQHTVRRAGLYTAAQREHHQRAMLLLAPAAQAPSLNEAPPPNVECPHSAPPPRCPHCQQPLLRVLWSPNVHHLSEISLPSQIPRPSG